eukprot:TRINITY_DN3633_c0_g1_i1.p1 TRINITY_DN3633_c0_g1~~TRINITY_DN3633_c0_g1_i1.p1  ORF type:complete len:5302 (-),score=561.54 TRINITY_DN3633_c0_g1_i1:86-14599(-)
MVYDAGVKVEISLNGADGDFYSAGTSIVKSVAFGLPTAVTPVFGWSSGGTVIVLDGVTWPEDADLEIDLVFRIPMNVPDELPLDAPPGTPEPETIYQESPTPCRRVNAYTAECTSPPAALPGTSVAPLVLAVRHAGDLHMFDLPGPGGSMYAFTYTTVPTFSAVDPMTAAVIGGTNMEVHGGPFDSRVPYWCGWLPLALPGEADPRTNLPARGKKPARFLDTTTLLCESPLILNPVIATMVVAIDQGLKVRALGSVTVEFFALPSIHSVDPPLCVVGEETTLYLKGVFKAESDLECVFLDTTGHRDRLTSALYTSAPPHSYHVTALRTRVALMGETRGRCQCPSLSTVVDHDVYVYLAVGKLIAPGPPFKIRFQRKPVALSTWAIPTPYGILKYEDLIVPMLQQQVGLGGGASFALFGGDMSDSLPNLTHCAVGPHLGEVYPVAKHMDTMPNVIMGGQMAVATCQLATMPLHRTGKSELVRVSIDGVRWDVVGEADVAPPLVLQKVEELSGQEGRAAAVKVTGNGFVPGCRCAFVGDERWDTSSALFDTPHLALAESSTVRSSVELHCAVPAHLNEFSTIAVAVVCPPAVVSSNILWRHLRPVPVARAVESPGVHRGATDQQVLLRGSGFLASSPLSCTASHSPKTLMRVRAWTDSLAACLLPSGPFRALSKEWVDPSPLLVTLVTSFGESSKPMPLRVDDPLDVHSVAPNLAYMNGEAFVQIVGKNLPVDSLWCRFGDQHVKAVVDPFTRQRRARCMVPPWILQNVTLQIVSAIDRPVSQLVNFTYRPPARIKHIAPRNYIPYVYTQEPYRDAHGLLNIFGDGFVIGDECEVKFGAYTATTTRVMSSVLIQAVLPSVSTNLTVPIHIFCTESKLQATQKDTLRFHFRHLPELESIFPVEVDLQGGEWLTLHGHHFQDQPGRCCLFGTTRVGLGAVRFLGSRTVRCRIPEFALEVEQVSIAFSNDGVYFSVSKIHLKVRTRFRVFAAAPLKAYVATPTAIQVVGRNFVPGLHCLFDERIRVDPINLQPDSMTCDMPGDFRTPGATIPLRIVESRSEDHYRKGRSMPQDKTFQITLLQPPRFVSSHPLSGTFLGGTTVVIRGENVLFDDSAACVFGSDDRLVAPAEIGKTWIRCSTVPSLDISPHVANITIRYFAEPPFWFVQTGMQFRFETMPRLHSLEPQAVWRGKDLHIFGEHFSHSLPMHCRFSNMDGSQVEEVIATLEIDLQADQVTYLPSLACKVPLHFAVGLVNVDVTLNHVDWSNSLFVMVHGHAPVAVQASPSRVSGYGSELVHMAMPAPKLLPGYGGGRCADDESAACLWSDSRDRDASGVAAAPSSCAAYAAGGYCGSLEFDSCCKRSCGLCNDQLLAESPKNLACLLDGWSVQPYMVSPSTSGEFAWACSLPPLHSGNHTLDLVLFSQSYRSAYPRADRPGDLLPILPIATAVVESWGGHPRWLGALDRDLEPRFVYSEGGGVVIVRGAPAHHARLCRFGGEALSGAQEPINGTAWCRSHMASAPAFDCATRPAPLIVSARLLAPDTVECRVPRSPINMDTLEPGANPVLAVYLGLVESDEGSVVWIPSRMAVTYERDLSASARVSPQRGPVMGGQELTILVSRGVGGISGGVPPHSRCLCRFDDIVVPAVCVAQLRAVRCFAPAVLNAGAVDLRFSTNDGVEWSAGSLRYEYYDIPSFSALHPPLGSMLEPVNVTLYGEHFPLAEGGKGAVPSYCRWQGSIIVRAKILSSSVLVCSLPSRSRFFPFDAAYRDIPITLEVSFAGDPPLWIAVGKELTFLHHEVPARAQQSLFIAPRQGVESAGGARITVTGANFVYPYSNRSLPKCVFGGRMMTNATVDSTTSMRCETLTLREVFPDAIAPMAVTVDVSFDAGQTRSRLNSVYLYLKDFDFERIWPSHGLVDGKTNVILKGRHFQRTPLLYCRFGAVAAAAQLLSEDRLTCTAPPQAEPGMYPVYYSVDAQTYLDTGLIFTSTVRPKLLQLKPKRGLRMGGTKVSIIADDLVYSSSLQCMFGYALIAMHQDDDGSLHCKAPPCRFARYADGVGPTGPDAPACFGFVVVQLTYNGQDMFGNVTYEYVRDPRVTSIIPFPASGWSKPLTVTLIGQNFYKPMFCKWWDLPSVEAVDISPTMMRCIVPALPEELRPSNVSGDDSVLSYLEVSPNDQDWTRFRVAWLWYKEPEVTGFDPDTTFRLYAPGGDFIVSGKSFRLLSPDFIMCVWYYDVNLPPERVKGFILAPDRLKCKPRLAAAEVDGGGGVLLQPPRVRLEVSMSPWVDSESNRSVLAEDRMHLRDLEDPTKKEYRGGVLENKVLIKAVENANCLWSGGCTVTLFGDHLWPKDRPDAPLFVSVGDTVIPLVKGVGGHHGTRFEVSMDKGKGLSPLWTNVSLGLPPRAPALLLNEAATTSRDEFIFGRDIPKHPAALQVASFRVPPVPHNMPLPAAARISLTRNLQDKTPLVYEIGYEPVTIGHFYRPELHNSTIQRCPVGTYCPGSSTNQSKWISSGEKPNDCPPTTWFGSTGGSTCMPCPEGVNCPRSGMDFPQRCEVGYICWGDRTYSWDANMKLCPAGTVCIRPVNGKTPEEEVSIYQRRLRTEGDMWNISPDRNTNHSVVVASLDIDNASSRKLRALPIIPADVLTAPCPAGYFCPPGTIAQLNDDGTWTILNAQPCTRPGVFCGENSMNMHTLDRVPLPGEYVSDDGTEILLCPEGSQCEGGPGFGLPIACPPGQYQLTPGAPRCSTCTAGTMCAGFGSTLPQICPAGRVCAHPGRMMPSYVCPAGSYCPPGVMTLNTMSGIPGSPKICPPGTYCVPGTASGSINDTDITAPSKCVEGTFCGANTTDAGGSDNCPPRWYCPRGMEFPQPSPPGHYVSESGTIFPSKCEPGSYAARWLMANCFACPAGTECPLDGTVIPTLCRPGMYREATKPTQAFSDNIMCSPCPQGTWNENGGLTSKSDCKNCDERYVCPVEGITRFATADVPCKTDDENEICYENSQGYDCPQGYGCGIATAAFTQYDTFCEPGFWCKVRTKPAEIRNLLCPPGYYCKQATGESGGSGRKAFTCPPQHFCPEGTGAINTRIGSKFVLLLFNRQADLKIITETSPDTAATCRRCPEEVPAGKFDLNMCTPCGRISDVEVDTVDASENTSRRLFAMGDRVATDSGGFKVWVFDADEEDVDNVGFGLPGDYWGPDRKEEAEGNFDIDSVDEEEWSAVIEHLSNAAGSVSSRHPAEMESVMNLETNVLAPIVVSGARRLNEQSNAQAENVTAIMSESIAEESSEKCAPDIRFPVPKPWQPGQPCYTAVEQWDVPGLRCPRGTESPLGAQEPDHCIQQGLLIAVMDVYKCYPPRPCARGFPPGYVCKPEEVLCGLDADKYLMDVHKADTTWKNPGGYIYGKPSPSGSGQIVNFLALDPVLDLDRYMSKPFYNISMQPMDIAVLYFDFTNLNSYTRLNAGDKGHFDIHIHTKFLAKKPAGEDWVSKGHLLPRFFHRAVNSRLHTKFQIRLLAMQELNFSVFLDLRHGAHIDHLHTLNESLDIKRFGPSRTRWGTRNFFAAVISQDLLLSGAFESPYNMPYGMGHYIGDEELVLDAINTSGRYNAPWNAREDGEQNGLLDKLTPGRSFWIEQNLPVVAMPWLPFFSNCDGFDSHIILWDLFENPAGADRNCELVDKEDTVVVPPFPFDVSTMNFQMSPVADNCNIIVQCRFEEGLDPTDYSSEPWFAIGEEEMTLFYITQSPVKFEDFDQKEDYFGPLEGQDELVKVTFEAPDRSLGARIPRRVIFNVGYYQETKESKLIVEATMSLSKFDSDINNEAYWLMLQFEALGWQELMNAFQLPYYIYAFLYCIIGLGSLSFTLLAWFILRMCTRKAETPPFRFKECYNFMLWWPLQGVVVASVPIVFICSVVKISLSESIDPMAAIPCTYEGLAAGNLKSAEQERCRAGRTGTCFIIGGVMIMWSGSKLIVPRLREVEEQFLLQQPSPMLNREGIPIPAEKRSLVREVPIRWKRGHLLFVSLMLMMPLTVMWEFTYCDFFGGNAILFIIGFSFAMTPVDGALSKAVREELLQVPLSTACGVVLFIGTLGANDFTDFCEGFFIELLIGIADRLVFVFVYKWIDQAKVALARWVRTRAWLWRLVILVFGGDSRFAKQLELTEGDAQDALEDEEEVEGTPVEEAMEEILGCGTTCMSTVLSPFLILAIIVFAEETRIPDMYGIRQTDLVCYLIFGLVIAPFQVMMDIFMNHSTEVAHGVRIYDYMLYAQFRWRNRLTQWLYDDPRMDQSIAEPLQSVNHLCFSPQFYFIETYYTWGMLLVLLSITIMLRQNMNPFDDPALIFFILQQLIVNRILDRIIKLMCFNVLWQPKANVIFKNFRKTVASSLAKKDHKVAQEKYRRYFLERHTGWVVDRLSEIFTPRARDRYRSKLSRLYQQVLMLQTPQVYKVPGPTFPEPTAALELPESLREELGESSESDENEPVPFELPPPPGTSVLDVNLEQLAELELPPVPEVGQVALADQAALPALPDLPELQHSRPGLPALSSLPSLPQLPMLPPQPPTMPALPQAWPLALPDGEAPSSGVGPMAILACRAWLETVRRRLIMSELAHGLKEDWQLKSKCSVCGIDDSSPVVQARKGLWKNGAGLHIAATRGIEDLILEFEVNRGVPPMPFDVEQWFAYLERLTPELFDTFCTRCSWQQGANIDDGESSLEIGDGVPPLPSLPAEGVAAASSLPALPDPPTVPGALVAAAGFAPVISDDESADESEEEAAPFAELQDVQVSMTSREMILYWAMQARRRVKARNALIEAAVQERAMRRALGDDEDDSDLDDEESPEASGDEGSDYSGA